MYFFFYKVNYSQEPICSSAGLKCVEKIKLDTSNCLKPCSGFIVTSFYKSERQKNLDDLFPIYGAYNIFKKITQIPSGYNGNFIKQFTLNVIVIVNYYYY